MSKSVDRLIKNYTNARKSWEVWCYMSGLNNDLKEVDRITRQKVNNEPLLFHLRFLAMKDYHIELYKILKNTSNNKDNIFNLLNRRLKSNPVNKSSVIAALDDLNNSISLAQDVCNIRDKYYAHLDKNYEKHTSQKTYVKDVGYLFSIIERAIISLTSEERLIDELNRIESREDYMKKGLF